MKGNASLNSSKWVIHISLLIFLFSIKTLVDYSCELILLNISNRGVFTNFFIFVSNLDYHLHIAVEIITKKIWTKNPVHLNVNIGYHSNIFRFVTMATKDDR